VARRQADDGGMNERRQTERALSATTRESNGGRMKKGKMEQRLLCI